MIFMARHGVLGLIMVFVQSFVLSACSNNSDTLFQSQSRQEIRYGEYEVQKGDSLYSIAWRYKRDYKELAQINGIQPPYVIRVGQKIKLATNQDEIPSKSGYTGITITEEQQKPAQKSNTSSSRPSHRKPLASWSKKSAPATKSSSSSINWQWPAKGELIQTFSASSTSVGKKGIQISGNTGDAILAAADGAVVYSGNSLVGYGNLVIVKHNETYLTAYAHNRRVLVKEGDKVNKGQKIAEMGSSGTDRNKLHFEIRKEGQPVNPLLYLPKQ